MDGATLDRSIVRDLPIAEAAREKRLTMMDLRVGRIGSLLFGFGDTAVRKEDI